MKRYYLFILFICCCSGLTAQSSILDALTRTVPGRGTVTIHQASAIRKLVGASSSKVESSNGKSYVTTSGYRIQVFSGNDQRTSKDEAARKKRQISEQYAIPTYVSYTAPFWRLRVGDFLSYEEAYSTMHKLIDSFPSFKKEISIIKDDVHIPIN